MCADSTAFEREPAEYRARAIESHRLAFELFRATCGLIEERVTVGRSHTSPYHLAIDCLFLQAYKTFCAIYLMGVRGHEEDAATLLRRLLEVTAQVQYLSTADGTGSRDERATRYLTHEPDQGGYWWQGTIRDLFTRIAAATTYDADYRLLAQISHAAARRVLPRLREGVVQIRSVEAFSHLLVFACRYVLIATRNWNEAFRLVPEDRLEQLMAETIGFRLQPLGQTPPQDEV